MEIPNVRAHKIISDDFILIFKFDKITLIYNYEILQKFYRSFCTGSKLIYVKKNRENEYVNIHVPLPIT